MLGQWWIANPADETDDCEPPESSERLPGILREVPGSKFALETIGFLSDHPFQTGRTLGPVSSQSTVDIWGTDRRGKGVSLLNCFRTNWTIRFPHIEGGHEDWGVGWHVEGDAWVTPDDKCRRVWIRTDDLQTWTLYRRPDNVTVNDTRDAVTIDLREETLGTATVGNLSVSLIRSISINHPDTGHTHERQFSVANDVNWRVDGTLTLKEVADDWANGLEWFARFMTMEPSAISGIDCSLADSDTRPLHVTLTIPSLPRSHDATKGRANIGSSPHEYLTTLDAFERHDIDLMTVFGGYWDEVVTGNMYTTMALHLESQDRLMNRGSDSALLNAIRSVEAQYAVNNPNQKVETVPVKTKIDDAINRAGDIGKQILTAWPALSKIGVLRRDVAHGRARVSSDFSLRCNAGAISIQWLQRLHLLIAMGVKEPVANAIIQENERFKGELRLLRTWSTEL